MTYYKVIADWQTDNNEAKSVQFDFLDNEYGAALQMYIDKVAQFSGHIALTNTGEVEVQLREMDEVVKRFQAKADHGD